MKKASRFFLFILTLCFLSLAFPTIAHAAPVENGRTILGETYVLESGRILDGDLNVIGGVVTIEEDATVNGNMFVLGGLVTIDGTIQGNLAVIGGTVTLEENAVIDGDLISPASYINRNPNAIINGNRIEGWNVPWTDYRFPSFFQTRTAVRPADRIIPAITRIGTDIALMLVIVGLGALLLLIAPKNVERMTQALISQPWQTLGYGVLTALAMFVGGLILTITICLIPVVIIVGLAFGLALLVGWLTLGYELGRRISDGLFKTKWSPVASAALGNFVLFLLAKGLDLVPCIGGFLNLIAMLFGLGMVLVTMFGTTHFPREMDHGEQDQMILLQTDQSHSAAHAPIEPSTAEETEHQTDQADSA
jgi:hypothetical protein